MREIKLSHFSELALKSWKQGNPKGFNNQIHKFHGSDTEAKYNENKKKKKKKMANIVDGFDYKFNSCGYRCDEFANHEKNKKTILFNGCSHSAGVGIPLENMYSYKVAKYYNVPHWNIAVGGSSTQLMATRSIYWLLHLKPTVHIFQPSAPTRVGMYHTYYPQHPDWWSSVMNPEADGYELKGLINEANFDWQSLSCLVTVNHICEQIGTKLLIADVYGHFGDDMVPYKNWFNILELIEWHSWKRSRHRDFGRDLMHFGPKTNKHMANKIIAELGDVL